MKKEHVNEQLAEKDARIAALENQISEKDAQIKSQESLSLSDMECILFHKKVGANPKAPDLRGEAQIGATRYNLAFWKVGNCLKGKVQDKVALMLELAEKKDPSFIPSVDTK